MAEHQSSPRAVAPEPALAQLGPEQERPDPEAETRRDAELEDEIERARDARREREPPQRPARSTWRTEESIAAAPAYPCL